MLKICLRSPDSTTDLDPVLRGTTLFQATAIQGAHKLNVDVLGVLERSWAELSNGGLEKYGANLLVKLQGET